MSNPTPWGFSQESHPTGTREKVSLNIVVPWCPFLGDVFSSQEMLPPSQVEATNYSASFSSTLLTWSCRSIDLHPDLYVPQTPGNPCTVLRMNLLEVPSYLLA